RPEQMTNRDAADGKQHRHEQQHRSDAGRDRVPGEQEQHEIEAGAHRKAFYPWIARTRAAANQTRGEAQEGEDKETDAGVGADMNNTVGHKEDEEGTEARQNIENYGSDKAPHAVKLRRPRCRSSVCRGQAPQPRSASASASS